MAVDHQAVIDEITAQGYFWKTLKEKIKKYKKDDHFLMGLKYKPGDKVIDKISGKEMIIVDGKRTPYQV